MSKNSGASRITPREGAILATAFLLAGLTYFGSDGHDEKTVAALAAIFPPLVLLRAIGDPTNTFKKWFSRIVLILVVLLAISVIVMDLYWIVSTNASIEGSHITIWGSLILSVVGGFLGLSHENKGDGEASKPVVGGI